ncbi:MAG: CusA/CzcA family heavy metal efflux RND transporter [Methylomonas sp.]|jgi:Cu(I)/Ag(I) efflux system membrane protein CusA/SilA
MIAWVIRRCCVHRTVVLCAALFLACCGIYAMLRTPLDVLPDLSDVQVIVKTSYPGQAPQIVEDQVTYPLTAAMLSVPGAVHVRGYSFLGESFIYVIFDDGVDTRAARSQVLEYLNQAQTELPPGASARLGVDASSVGWIYQYALVDRSGKHNLAELRSLQDWFIKFELQSLPGVAEAATVGGMVKQYQVVVDPGRMRANALSLSMIRKMIVDANQEVSGSVIEMGEAEFMIRSKGYIKTLADLANLSYQQRREAGAALQLKDIADIRIGPQMRRGIAELNGEGEVAGGIIVMRRGWDVLTTISEVKNKLAALKTSLPEGVEIVETYDRSELITRAINTLTHRLLEEFAVIILVSAIFLGNLRYALVIVLSLPVAVLTAFFIMQLQDVNANLMSLGGIAIALGAATDASIVMVENIQRRLEHTQSTEEQYFAALQDAIIEVAPALFFSLLVITLSFLPVFALQAQEGRLFAPLAYTKTYTMAAAAILSITLAPALAACFLRKSLPKLRTERLNIFLQTRYLTLINAVLRRPWRILALALLLAASSYWPLTRMGTEFMPRLDEGDLLYMPSTMPGLSIGKAQQLLQQTDRLIKTAPEVDTVFGKIGQAETATDAAPLTMMETLIRLKPKSQWRNGMTLPKLIQELNKQVSIPGLVNSWQAPIAARIDMLATGVKTPLGVKIAGPELKVIEDIALQIEQLLRSMPGTASVYAERLSGAHYIDIDIDAELAAHYGLSPADIHETIAVAVGGMNVSYAIEGRERYPINIRYPTEVRNSLSALKDLPVFLAGGQQIRLADVADVAIKDGPEMIKSEDARLNAWVYADISGRDLGTYAADAQELVGKNVKLPAGYSISWSGRYHYLARTAERLGVIAPLAVVLILFLLYINFHNFTDVLVVMGTLPLALSGGAWLLYWLDYPLSGASGVGFIALAGVAVEFGVVILIYLHQAMHRLQPSTAAELNAAVAEGAALRVRSKAMTVLVVTAGLLPIMAADGAGSDIMRAIAAPMVGGMITAPLASMLVIPALYSLLSRKHSRI